MLTKYRLATVATPSSLWECVISYDISKQVPKIIIIIIIILEYNSDNNNNNTEGTQYVLLWRRLVVLG